MKPVAVPSGTIGSPARPRNPGLSPPVIPCALAILCLLLVPAAMAWTVQDLTVEPAGGTVPPRALVTVSYVVIFDPAMEANSRTFDAGHALDMTTELTGATWSATLVNIGQNRDPVTTPLGAKTGAEYRIEGSTLSYGDADLNLIVTIRGTAPDIRDQERVIVSVRELDENGEPVPDAGDTVTYLVGVPTTVATALKTPATTTITTAATSGSRETVRVPGGVGTTATQTVRPTYAPGPDPMTVIVILSFAGFVASRTRRGRTP